jgi:hypothetical protein
VISNVGSATKESAQADFSHGLIEFATETRDGLLYEKDGLLANGDRWEPELARSILAAAPYR